MFCLIATRGAAKDVAQKLNMFAHQVAPAELESLLLTHPAVVDAAVIGIPDDRDGELPRAFIKLRPNTKVTGEEIQDFVKGSVIFEWFKNFRGIQEFLKRGGGYRTSVRNKGGGGGQGG